MKKALLLLVVVAIAAAIAVWRPWQRSGEESPVATANPKEHEGHTSHEVHAPPATSSPHAGHEMTAPAEPAGSDPHAGHEMLATPEPTAIDPHAGHTGAATPSAAEPSSPVRTPITLSEQRQQLIGVRTGKVTRDKLLMSVRAVGIIEPDQTRLVRVHSRVSGWVTKVYANYVGQQVRKGDPLLEIYSRDLLGRQQEFLLSLSSSNTGGLENKAEYIAASRRRLELMGVADEELAELERSKKPHDSLLMRSPVNGRILDRNLLEGSYVEPATELYRISDLSTVWVQAKVYQYELPHIELNQPVSIFLPAQPEKEYQGKVTFIEPIVQEATRTVKVRVEIPNPDEALKPGMYADLRIDHNMGAGLLIPEFAVLRTGERAVAFRALGAGRFEPVEVRLGGRFGERFQVLAGLAEGDTVATSAVFLIDSESRLKAVTSGGGHQHAH